VKPGQSRHADRAAIIDAHGWLCRPAGGLGHAPAETSEKGKNDLKNYFRLL
jgi:hypothetical protein